MVLRWSAYIHPRLNYAAFVAVADEIRGGGLKCNSSFDIIGVSLINPWFSERRIYAVYVANERDNNASDPYALGMVTSPTCICRSHTRLCVCDGPFSECGGGTSLAAVPPPHSRRITGSGTVVEHARLAGTHHHHSTRAQPMDIFLAVAAFRSVTLYRSRNPQASPLPQASVGPREDQSGTAAYL